MFKAWEKGISTADFRKCATQDLDFIDACQNSVADKIEQQEHQARIKQAMDGLKW